MAGNRGKGRPKGTPNKTTAAVKEAILNAFEKVGKQDYLVKVAREDYKTFCALLGKVLPAEMNLKTPDLRDKAAPLDHRQLARALMALSVDSSDDMPEPTHDSKATH